MIKTLKEKDTFTFSTRSRVDEQFTKRSRFHRYCLNIYRAFVAPPAIMKTNVPDKDKERWRLHKRDKDRMSESVAVSYAIIGRDRARERKRG